MSTADPVSASPPAKQILHFKLQQKLGSGSFGTVWKAYDTKLARWVAIKIPRSDKQRSSPIAEVVLREARAVAQLQHPNIISVYEIRRFEDTVIIVTAYVEGLPLQQWTVDKSPSHRESALLVAKIADALHHAHENGVFHRDVKPSNVLVDGAGEPHIMDFGLAKRDDPHAAGEQQPRLVGTPLYMSPEQAGGYLHLTDRRTDIYSLGVVFFELLTGERPFRGNNLRVLIKEILREEPPDPRSLDPRIPLDLEVICLKCLEKSRRRRYQTAAELAADLRRWLNKEPIQARPLSRLERGWRWCQRHPQIAGLTATIVLGTAAAMLVICWLLIAAVAARDNARTARDFADHERTRAEEALQLAARQRDELEHQLYLNRVTLAQRDLEQHRITRCEQLLQQCAVKERGWEWNYLTRLARTESLSLARHPALVSAVAIAPSLGQIATGCHDGKVRLFDGQSGKLLATLDDRCQLISGLAFNARGTRLAVANDNVAALWDLQSRTVQFRIRHPRHLATCLAFAPIGELLALGGSDGQVSLIDANTGVVSKRWAASKSKLNAVTFHPGGAWLGVADGEGGIRIWDVKSGNEQARFAGHALEATALAFMPDGARLVSAGADQTLRVWEVAGGKEIRVIRGHAGPITQLGLTANGDRAVTASLDHSIKTWSLATGEELATHRGHDSAIHALALEPARDWAFAGDASGEVKRFNVADDPRGRVLSVPGGAVHTLAFDQASRRLLTGGADGVPRLWDVATGRLQATLSSLQAEINAAAINTEGTLLVVAGGRGMIQICEISSGQVLRSWRGHGRTIHCLAIDPRQRWIATGSDDHTVKVWELASGREVVNLADHQGEVLSAVFSPTSDVLVTGSADDKIRFWNTGDFKPLRHIVDQGGDVRFLALGRQADGLVAGDERGAVVRAMHTGAVQGRLLGATAEVRAVCLHPTETRIAFVFRNGLVQLWDTMIFAEVLSTDSGQRDVTCAQFSPDGAMLAIGTTAGQVRICRAEPSGSAHLASPALPAASKGSR